MTGRQTTILLLLCFSIMFGQDNKPKWWMFGNLDYTYQQTHNLGLALGPALRFKRHTYVTLMPGFSLIRSDRTTYFRPTAQIEYGYQPKFWNGAIWPIFRIGYLPLTIRGRSDNYISTDFGIRVIGATVYAGYNFVIDNKDIDNISNLRVGIKIP